ncbi:MAG: aldo/keto reductase [Chloroflexi bacterium]|nr:aldo/keto reductase [Chloroflexota bacterium]MCL5273231.1 aldo/keto reductase [Chloroflexota bacterium]
MITKLTFGRTGHASTKTIFGAAALGSVTQDEADRTLDVLLKYGINHIDTAASYGESELRIGPWMARHRKDFFLATKTGERTYQKARDEFHRSLERLRVDSVDLIQLHYLVDPHEWEVAMGPGGALEALIEAREQKLVRYIGVTGHDLTVARMHMRSLERFDFDSVLLPYNYVLSQNAEYMADFNKLFAICQQRNVAVQTIKSMARGPWGDKPHTHATWYEPLTDQKEIDTAVNFVLSKPGIFLNTSGDIRVMPKVVDAASRFNADIAGADAAKAAAELELTPLFLH